MISPQLLRQVADIVQAKGVGEAAVAQLRGVYSGVHFSYCLDDDVADGEPALRRGGFNLYLVDGRDHCLKLTTDADAATGLLLAELVQD